MNPCRRTVLSASAGEDLRVECTRIVVWTGEGVARYVDDIGLRDDLESGEVVLPGG